MREIKSYMSLYLSKGKLFLLVGLEIVRKTECSVERFTFDGFVEDLYLAPDAPMAEYSLVFLEKSILTT